MVKNVLSKMTDEQRDFFDREIFTHWDYVYSCMTPEIPNRFKRHEMVSMVMFKAAANIAKGHSIEYPKSYLVSIAKKERGRA